MSIVFPCLIDNLTEVFHGTKNGGHFAQRSRVRVKFNFLNQINADSTVHPSAQKYFALPVGQIIFIPSRHPGPIRGAFRDRHERWAGMQWTLQARKANAREADGEVVWS